MRSEEYDWKTEEFGASHQGRPGAVLADGAEPKPVTFDLGSGTNVHETSNWWVYDGNTLGAPRATALRGACSCGWRGSALHPIDWEQIAAEGPEWWDTQGPHDDWKQHSADVEHQAVPVPEDIAGLLARRRERLDVLADDAPLAALRIVAALEHVTAETATVAAYAVRADEQSWDTNATGLGLTEDDARTRLHRYARPY
ncbi:hypothetical protein JCM13580A_62500 [Streptomyces drozdowiczii]|uniref:hypothetical protein n=1 Tax=Streptomyces drozdowiczii TaxID=202862 RepID=UPI0031F09AF2